MRQIKKLITNQYLDNLNDAIRISMTSIQDENLDVLIQLIYNRHILFAILYREKLLKYITNKKFLYLNFRGSQPVVYDFNDNWVKEWELNTKDEVYKARCVDFNFKTLFKNYFNEKLIEEELYPNFKICMKQYIHCLKFNLKGVNWVDYWTKGSVTEHVDKILDINERQKNTLHYLEKNKTESNVKKIVQTGVIKAYKEKLINRITKEGLDQKFIRDSIKFVFDTSDMNIEQLYKNLLFIIQVIGIRAYEMDKQTTEREKRGLLGEQLQIKDFILIEKCEDFNKVKDFLVTNGGTRFDFIVTTKSSTDMCRQFFT